MISGSVEFERQKPSSVVIIEGLALPLFLHKKESDALGKHENWSPIVHKIAEIAAIGADIGFHCLVGIYLLYLHNELQAAVVAEVAYRTAVDVVPDRITQFGKRILRNNL